MKVIMLGCVTQSNVISSDSRSIFACITNGDLIQLHQIVGYISFSNVLDFAFALYAFYEYMFLRPIIETQFVPSVLVHY